MFTYTSKNILLIIGIMLFVLLGLKNTCKFLNGRLSCIFCPLIGKAVAFFLQQMSHPDGTRFK